MTPVFLQAHLYQIPFSFDARNSMPKLKTGFMRFFLCAIAIIAHGKAHSAAPGNNPISARYGAGYSWTDYASGGINWSNVVDITTYYSGGTYDSAFVLARNAVAVSGGVVYFPAGTYNFSAGIQLTDKVVIRGDNPTLIVDSTARGYSPPTKFIFPALNIASPAGTSTSRITTMNPDTDSNIGIVNIDINRAAISIVGDPDGGHNSNIVIFGVRSNNVAAFASQIPASYQNSSQRFSDINECNIKIQAFSNVLVANNRINDFITDNFMDNNYYVKDSAGVPATVSYYFNYADHTAIQVNRSKLTTVYSATSISEQSLFRSGINIIENYAYNVIGSGIKVSGSPLKIQSNYVEGDPGNDITVKWLSAIPATFEANQAAINYTLRSVDPTGLVKAAQTDLHFDHGIDWLGSNALIDSNSLKMYSVAANLPGLCLGSVACPNMWLTEGEGIYTTCIYQYAELGVSKTIFTGTKIDNVTISNNYVVNSRNCNGCHAPPIGDIVLFGVCSVNNLDISNNNCSGPINVESDIMVTTLPVVTNINIAHNNCGFLFANSCGTPTGSIHENYGHQPGNFTYYDFEVACGYNSYLNSSFGQLPCVNAGCTGFSFIPDGTPFNRAPNQIVVQEPHQAGNSCIFCADPFDTALGAVAFTSVDFSYPKQGFPAEFKRYYSSIPANNSPGLELGYGWSHNYAQLFYYDTLDPVQTPPRLYTPERTYSDFGSGKLYQWQFVNTSGYSFLNSYRTQYLDIGKTAIQTIDKMGMETYFSNFYPGPSNVWKPIAQKDRNGNMLLYTYKMINVRRGLDSKPYQDTQLSSVSYKSPGSITGWSIAFEYFTYFDPAFGRVFTNNKISRITSTLGDSVTFNDTMTIVTRSSKGLADFGATYQYDSDTRLLTQKIDNKEKPGSKKVTYTYQAVINGGSGYGMRNYYNGRGDLTYQLVLPADCTIYPLVTSLKDGLGNTLRTDTYQNSQWGPQLTNSVKYLNGVAQSPEVYGYDSNDYINSFEDSDGNVTTMTNDSKGNILTRQDANTAALEETFSYNDYSRLTSYSDRKGISRTYTYDASTSINLTEINESSLGRRTTFDYYPSSGGFLQSMTRWDGSSARITTFHYDGYGFSKSVQEPSLTLPDGTTQVGATSFYHFNEKGQLLTFTNPMGQVTYYTWDSSDGLGMNKIRYISSPQTGAATYVYYTNGELYTLTDENGNLTEYFYDGDSNISDIYQAKGSADESHTVLNYDARSNRIRVHNSTNETTFIYNEQDKLKSMTQPGTLGTTSYTYDGALNLITQQDNRGVVITYSYDVDNQLTGKSFSDGTTSISYDHDPNGNRKQMVDAEGTKNYTFDDLNRMTQVVNVNQGNFQLDYLYNLFDECVSVQNNKLPSGKDLTKYTYYENGKLKTDTDVDGSVTTYRYNLDKKLTQIDYPLGVAKSSLTYDLGHGWLTKVVNSNSKNEVLSRFAYGHRSDGNINSSTDLVGQTTFDYDGIFRLANASYPDSRGFNSYKYDKLGNRLKWQQPGISIANSYDLNGTNEVKQSGAYTILYDNAGNMRKKTGQGVDRSFAWDALNRLSEVRNVQSNSVIADYTYNGDGWRIQKVSASSGTTNYLMDRGSVVLETDGAGNIQKRYHPGISVVDVSGNTAYYLYDGRGNVAGLADVNGHLVNNYVYDGFGKAVGVGNDKNGYRFVGNFRVFVDDEIGLTYMRHRWYDTDLGRFVSQDSFGFFGGNLNLYLYTNNDPVNNTDPNGTFCWTGGGWSGALIGGFFGTIGSVKKAMDHNPNWMFDATEFRNIWGAGVTGSIISSVAGMIGDPIISIFSEGAKEYVDELWSPNANAGATAGNSFMNGLETGFYIQIGKAGLKEKGLWPSFLPQ
jgi:RHS repeat-associated protein